MWEGVGSAQWSDINKSESTLKINKTIFYTQKELLQNEILIVIKAKQDSKL